MRNIDRIPKAVVLAVSVLSFLFSAWKTVELRDQSAELIQTARMLKSTCR
jgi:hypothetical protein